MQNPTEWVAKDAPKGEVGGPRATETVLEEAQRLIHGDRNAFYGPPGEDFAKTAKMVTGLLLPKLRPGVEVTAREAILIMVIVKASREVNRPKRDNAVDIAGYAGLLEMLGDYGKDTE